jgi:alanine racemase
MTRSPSSSIVHVDLEQYAANLRAIRARIPDECAILTVVKCNAYGMGAGPIAKRAVAEGVAMLGVATIAEGVALREAGIETPILVMVQPRPEELADAVRHQLRVGISDFQTAERLGDIARKEHTVAAVHCEIDTGMGRQGFQVEGAVEELRNVTRISNVDIESIYTHFAIAENPDDPFTENQARNFRQLVQQLDREGVPFESVHAANSGGLLYFPQFAMDMVRPGLISYGVWPGKTKPHDGPFKCIARWTTKVALVRDLAGGASISYGRTYFAPSPMKIAAIPVGYGDGYPYALSNRAEVLIRGVRCPVRGLVTMNEMLVDVTRLPECAPGDEVTLLGSDGSDEISVEELAGKAGLPPHNILTGIAAHVTRTYSS